VRRAFPSWLLLAGLIYSQVAAAEVDRFYLDLLHEGTQNFQRGDFIVAARQLRIACFGMLDDPVQLASCLVRLGMAQTGAGDNDGFRDTFKRLAEAQDRFGAYAKATLPPDLRAAYEQKAVSVVPPQLLGSSAYFAQLQQRQTASQIAALAPRERRRKLEERISSEPKNAQWHVMMAELELGEDHGAAALAQAESAVNLGPSDPSALCARGLARASAHRCEEALKDLEPCARCQQDALYAIGLLGCRIEQGKWQQADEQIRFLPAEWRQDKRISPLIQRNAEHLKASQPNKQPGAHTDERTESPKATVPSRSAPQGAGAGRPVSLGIDQPGASSPRAAPRSPKEAADVARARILLDDGRSKDRELQEALRLSSTVAAAHPEWAEAQLIAGEAAYRNSHWSEAAGYFLRGGELGDAHPDLLFYLAVSLFETGDKAGAESALKKALPRLQSNAYIESYARKIMGSQKP
jgi:hypothetical protein